jgi:hypothetical protein
LSEGIDLTFLLPFFFASATIPLAVAKVIYLPASSRNSASGSSKANSEDELSSLSMLERAGGSVLDHPVA